MGILKVLEVALKPIKQIFCYTECQVFLISFYFIQVLKYSTFFKNALS